VTSGKSLDRGRRLWLIEGKPYEYNVLRAGDLNHTHIGKRIYQFGAPMFIVVVYHGIRSSVGVRYSTVGQFKQWRLDPNDEVFVTKVVV
jgi:hypothetical protein